MIVLIILLYLAFGFCISCFYNAVNSVPMPDEMKPEEKHMMFLIIIGWPICIVVWFVKELVAALKWAICRK